MSDTDDLCRDLILDHFKNPRNHGRLPEPTVDVEGVNPLCGDHIQLTLAVNGEKVDDIRVEGRGCSISQASASIMTQAVKGKTFGECESLVREFKRLMLENAPADTLPEDLEDAAALEGVKKFPARIKCAVLSWNTLTEALKAYRESRAPVRKKHEEQ